MGTLQQPLLLLRNNDMVNVRVCVHVCVCVCVWTCVCVAGGCKSHASVKTSNTPYVYIQVH